MIEDENKKYTIIAQGNVLGRNNRRLEVISNDIKELNGSLVKNISEAIDVMKKRI